MIEIRNKYNNNIIISGEYSSISEALEKNRCVNLSNADLRGVNLSDADLRCVTLSNANLSGANLRDADLRGVNLSDTNLSDTNLRGANLSGANLSYTYLRGANLRYADLRDVDLRGADLRDADLSGANLRDFIFIKGSKFDLYCIKNYIQIGCERHCIDWWTINGEKCGKENNFTENQIEEYKKYINVCIQLNKGETK